MLKPLTPLNLTLNLTQCQDPVAMLYVSQTRRLCWPGAVGAFPESDHFRRRLYYVEAVQFEQGTVGKEEHRQGRRTT